MSYNLLTFNKNPLAEPLPIGLDLGKLQDQNIVEDQTSNLPDPSLPDQNLPDPTQQNVSNSQPAIIPDPNLPDPTQDDEIPKLNFFKLSKENVGRIPRKIRKDFFSMYENADNKLNELYTGIKAGLDEKYNKKLEYELGRIHATRTQYDEKESQYVKVGNYPTYEQLISTPGGKEVKDKIDKEFTDELNSLFKNQAGFIYEGLVKKQKDLFSSIPSSKKVARTQARVAAALTNPGDNMAFSYFFDDDENYNNYSSIIQSFVKKGDISSPGYLDAVKKRDQYLEYWSNSAKTEYIERPTDQPVYINGKLHDKGAPTPEYAVRVENLKQGDNVRVPNGGTWLYWQDDSGNHHYDQIKPTGRKFYTDKSIPAVVIDQVSPEEDKRGWDISQGIPDQRIPYATVDKSGKYFANQFQLADLQTNTTKGLSLYGVGENALSFSISKQDIDPKTGEALIDPETNLPKLIKRDEDIIITSVNKSPKIIQSDLDDIKSQLNDNPNDPELLRRKGVLERLLVKSKKAEIDRYNFASNMTKALGEGIYGEKDWTKIKSDVRFEDAFTENWDLYSRQGMFSALISGSKGGKYGLTGLAYEYIDWLKSTNRWKNVNMFSAQNIQSSLYDFTQDRIKKLDDKLNNTTIDGVNFKSYASTANSVVEMVNQQTYKYNVTQSKIQSKIQSLYSAAKSGDKEALKTYTSLVNTYNNNAKTFNEKVVNNPTYTTYLDKMETSEYKDNLAVLDQIEFMKRENYELLTRERMARDPGTEAPKGVDIYTGNFLLDMGPTFALSFVNGTSKFLNSVIGVGGQLGSYIGGWVGLDGGARGSDYWAARTQNNKDVINKYTMAKELPETLANGSFSFTNYGLNILNMAGSAVPDFFGSIFAPEVVALSRSASAAQKFINRFPGLFGLFTSGHFYDEWENAEAGGMKGTGEIMTHIITKNFIQTALEGLVDVRDVIPEIRVSAKDLKSKFNNELDKMVLSTSGKITPSDYGTALYNTLKESYPKIANFVGKEFTTEVVQMAFEDMQNTTTNAIGNYNLDEDILNVRNVISTFLVTGILGSVTLGAGSLRSANNRRPEIIYSLVDEFGYDKVYNTLVELRNSKANKVPGSEKIDEKFVNDMIKELPISLSLKKPESISDVKWLSIRSTLAKKESLLSQMKTSPESMKPVFQSQIDQLDANIGTIMSTSDEALSDAFRKDAVEIIKDENGVPIYSKLKQEQDATQESERTQQEGVPEGRIGEYAPAQQGEQIKATQPTATVSDSDQRRQAQVEDIERRRQEEIKNTVNNKNANAVPVNNAPIVGTDKKIGDVKHKVGDTVSTEMSGDRFNFIVTKVDKDGNIIEATAIGYREEGQLNVYDGKLLLRTTLSDINSINRKYNAELDALGKQVETTQPTADVGNINISGETQVTPVAPGKRLFNDPNPEAAIVEEQFKKEKGIVTPEPAKITAIDENRSKTIADAYEQMVDSPNDPQVQAAYKALADETMDQFDAISKSGVKVEVWTGEGEPYKNSGEMIADVRDNKHMYIFSTEAGFGDTKITDEQRQQNAMLRDSGFKDVNGRPLLVNDVFRFVHDYFGHTRLGNSFGAIGEENAWNVHARMYSPLARRAMTTETRGQNSWVNFNRSLRNPDGSMKKKGDEGYIPPAQRPFAEQKMGFLPEEFSNIEDAYSAAPEVTPATAPVTPAPQATPSVTPAATPVEQVSAPVQEVTAPVQARPLTPEENTRMSDARTMTTGQFSAKYPDVPFEAIELIKQSGFDNEQDFEAWQQDQATKANQVASSIRDTMFTAKADMQILSHALLNSWSKKIPGLSMVWDNYAENVEKAGFPAEYKEYAGFYDPKTKTVYINPDKMGLDTPIHEFGHVWYAVANMVDKNITKRGRDLIRGTEYEARVRAIDEYKDLEPEEIEEEALILAIGERGADIIDMARRSNFLTWLSDLFNFVAQKFGIDVNIENLNLGEFLDFAAMDILSGGEVFLSSSSDVEVEATGVKPSIVSAERFAIQSPQVKSRLDNAKRMESEGMTPDDIWEQTGMENIDGKWMTELDYNVKIIADINNVVDGMDRRGEPFAMLPLANVLSYPEFFKLYPDAKKLRVKVSRFNDTYLANFSQDMNLIRLNVDADKYAAVGGDYTSAMLHEIQHFIQSKDNLPRGTNIKAEFNNAKERLSGIFEKSGFSTAANTIRGLEYGQSYTGNELDLYNKTLAAAKFAYYTSKGEAQARNVEARFVDPTKREYRTVETKDIQRPKASVIAYHGSPYSFDRFTTQAIGTGEGNQSFGWGLYFTEIEDIARRYAKEGELRQLENSIGDYTFDGDDIGQQLIDFLKAGGEISDWIKRREELLKNRKEQIASGEDFRGTTMANIIERLEFSINSAKQIQDKISRNVYDVTIHKGKQPSEYTWLVWDKKPNREQVSNLISKLNQKQRDAGFYYGLAPNATNKDLYKGLSRALGGDKQASLFLLENGIDGIKYPAESLSKGKTSETAIGFNYVVFDENAVTIESKIKASVKSVMESNPYSKFMTEDADSYYFFHWSNEQRKVIDPNKFGNNRITSREERIARPSAAFFYTRPDFQEMGVGDYGHVVKIPKDKVYPATADPLNFFDEAKALFEKSHPGMAFGPNQQIGWITKVANAKGYEMVVAKWGKQLRAETTNKVKPEWYQMPEGWGIKTNPKYAKLKKGVNKLSVASRYNVDRVRNDVKAGNKIAKGLAVYTRGGQKIIEGTADLSLEYVKNNAPEVFISNANIILQYPIIKGVKDISSVNTIEEAQEIYDIFSNQISDNLKYLIEEFAPEFRDISTLWYDGANIIAQNFSKKYGVSAEQAAGIIASLSPQKDWYQNVRLAEMVMMAFRENPSLNKAMIDKQISVISEGEKPKLKDIKKAQDAYNKNKTKQNKQKLEDKKDAHKKYMADALSVVNMLKNYIGKRLNEVPDQIKPYIVRLSNEVNTTKDYDILSPDGRVIGVAMKSDGITKAKVAWGSYTEIGKAVSIMVDGSQENINKSLGQMHKIRNFYNNIIDPMSNNNDVTMDTHAVAAALLMPLSGNSKEVGQNFGTGTSNSGPFGIKGLYYAYADGYKKAAESYGLLPRQVQSITWEAVRGLFTDTFKSNKDNVNNIKSIWDLYANKKIDINETRSRINESAGGIKDPTWAESASGGRGAVQIQPGVSVKKEGVGRGPEIPGRVDVRDRSGRTGAGEGPTILEVKPSISSRYGLENGWSERAINEARTMLNNGMFQITENTATGPVGFTLSVNGNTHGIYSSMQEAENQRDNIIKATIMKGYPQVSEMVAQNILFNAKRKDLTKPLNPSREQTLAPTVTSRGYVGDTRTRSRKIKDATRAFFRKYFTFSKGLPKEIITLKEALGGKLSYQVSLAEAMVKDMKKAAKKIDFNDWTTFDQALRDYRVYNPTNPFWNGGQPGYSPAANTNPSFLKLPNEMKEFVVSMRALLDGMSEQLVRNGLVSPETALTIESNMGKYVHRSYALFTMGDEWSKKVKNNKKIIDTAHQNLFQLYYAHLTNTNPNLTQEEIILQSNEEADKEINRILDSKKPFFGRDEASFLPYRNTGSLKQRQELPQWLRDLMGEYTDPGTAFLLSVGETATLLQTSDYLAKLRDFGLGTVFFEEGNAPADATYRIGSMSQALKPLEGLLTTKEMYDLLVETDNNRSSNIKWLWRLMNLNKMMKTVFSPVTQAKNFVSNTGFALHNGHFDVTAISDAWSYFRRQVINNKTQDVLEGLRPLFERGVLNQSLTAKELAEIFRTNDFEQYVLDNADKTGIQDYISDPGKLWRATTRGTSRVYQASDDFWKIYAYYNEQRSMSKVLYNKKYESLTQSEKDIVDNEAADRVMNTYPTYDRVLEIFKTVSKTGVLGNFVAFRAEVFRVMANTYAYAYNDIRNGIKEKNPRMVAYGTKRLLGIATYNAIRMEGIYLLAKYAGLGVSGLASSLWGGGDDEDKEKMAINSFVADWAKSDDKIYNASKIKDGIIEYYTFSSVDPYATIYNIFNAYKYGNEYDEKGGAIAAGLEIVAPFIEPEMTVRAFSSVIMNKDSYGFSIYNEDDTYVRNFFEGAKYVAKETMTPGVVTWINRMFYRRDDEGKLQFGFNPSELYTAPIGARPYVANIGRKWISELKNGKKDVFDDASLDFSLSAKNNESYEDRANYRYNREVLRLHKLYVDALTLGYPKEKLLEGLRSSRLDRRTMIAIVTGETFRAFDKDGKIGRRNAED